MKQETKKDNQNQNEQKQGLTQYSVKKIRYLKAKKIR